MSGDARVSAWMGAWNRIEHATNLRSEFRQTQVEGRSPLTTEELAASPLPDDYWATIAEAQAFAQLAQADQTVGMYAMDALERVEAQRRESDLRRAEHLESVLREEGGR